MIRAIWFAVLAALAGIAVCAQLDRASVRRPELAPLVPAPFRSFALQPLAVVGMIALPPDEARAEAVRLVRRRPVPADNLFLLALANQRAGKLEDYRTAFRLATERGWRNPPLQMAAAREAIAKGDHAAAALRLAALWAVGSVDPDVGALTRTVIDDPRGAAAFGEQLARTRAWQSTFVAVGPAFVGKQQTERAIAAARSNGTNLP